MSAATGPITETMKISEVRSQLNALADRVYKTGDRIIVEKSGIPVMVLLPAQEIQGYLTWKESRDDAFSILDRIREKSRGISEDELMREADKALAEVRAGRSGSVGE